ncbi:MAG TPA: hypothetical protein VND65_18050 [Candidatus Binatia bacterium]|nr:hypothetical protein [Candidatus Binatia bacterium]
MSTFAVGAKVVVNVEFDELRPADVRAESGVIGTVSAIITAVAPRTLDRCVIQRQDQTGWILAPNSSNYLATST